MPKFAVIFEASPFDRKGLFNAVHNRVKHLISSGKCEVDVFCIHSKDSSFTRKVRQTPKVKSVDHVILDGIKYNLLWYRFSILDHVIVEKFHRRPLLFRRFIKNSLSVLKGYDAVISHSFTGGLLAYEAFCCYGIPYYASWHGSDVHTHPWRVPVILEDTIRIMENAVCNFFVSKALMMYSSKIAQNAVKKVLYNGVADDFVKFDEVKRAELRTVYGLATGEKVVAYVGNLSAVKNVLVLPEVFAEVAKRYAAPLKFWIVGDGKQRQQLSGSVSELATEDPRLSVRFFGNLSAEEMPTIMNCIDVLVLPSKNEGLGMVCAEAIRCGANAVGAAVGGIAEVVGAENVVPHGDGFVNGMAEKIAHMLSSEVKQELPADIDWTITASAELAELLR